jgi:CRP/FNR family nitrogen fixation transcriptional regulator
MLARHSSNPLNAAPLFLANSASSCPTSRLEQSMNLVGTVIPYPRGVEIFGENEPAEYVYKVLRGVVRASKILSDGRRQIAAFYLPGDVFALEGGDVHPYTAEAVDGVTLLVAKRSAIASMAETDAGVTRDLWALASRELQRAQRHTLLLICSAQERVARFLLEISERLGAPERFELPMSRQDIADYLGLTIETVSRTLTQMQTEATIAVPRSRQIVLKNRNALRRLNS